MPTLLEKPRAAVASWLPSRQVVLACSWDQDELTCLLASGVADRICVVAAASFPVDNDEDATGERQWRLWLAENGVKRPTVLVGLRRSQVDMFDLSLPPARDDELPELVMNQALSEVSEFTDESVSDYYPLNDDPGQGRAVSVAVVSADVLQSAQEVGNRFGSEPTAIVLRALSTSSLLRRLTSPAQSDYMVIHLMAGEADFTVVSGEKVVFTRTNRFSTDMTADSLVSHLVAEIQRTWVVAARNENGERPERIYLFGDSSETKELASQLADEVSVPVSLVNPLEGIEVQTDIRQVHRYAALVGMIRDHFDDAHQIDFANPKQPPPPPNYRRKAAFYAAAAAVLLAIGGYAIADRLGEVDDENQRLAEQVSAVEKLLAKTKNKRQTVMAVESWQSDGVNWLEELRTLSAQFPNATDAVVARMTMSPGSGDRTGVTDFLVRVRDPEVISRLENRLRDSRHRVRTQRLSQQEKDSEYPWQFQTNLEVLHRDDGDDSSSGDGAETNTPPASGPRAPQPQRSTESE